MYHCCKFRMSSTEMKTYYLEQCLVETLIYFTFQVYAEMVAKYDMIFKLTPHTKMTQKYTDL